VNSVSAVVGGKSISRSGNTAICDTGTTLCLVDTALCKAVYSHIHGAKYDSQSEGWIFPSSVAESQLPAIQIGLGDPGSGGEQKFNIYPRDLVFAEASQGYFLGGTC
jgi:Eukaryotic aspartyl protease